MWKPNIVLIAECDVIAAAERNGVFEILDEAEVGLVSVKPDPRVAARVLLKDLVGPVTGNIVSDDDFQVGVILLQQRVNLSLQILLPIVSAEGNGDQCSFFFHFAPVARVSLSGRASAV